MLLIRYCLDYIRKPQLCGLFQHPHLCYNEHITCSRLHPISCYNINKTRCLSRLIYIRYSSEIY